MIRRFRRLTQLTELGKTGHVRKRNTKQNLPRRTRRALRNAVPEIPFLIEFIDGPCDPVMPTMLFLILASGRTNV